MSSNLYQTIWIVELYPEVTLREVFLVTPIERKGLGAQWVVYKRTPTSPPEVHMGDYYGTEASAQQAILDLSLEYEAKLLLRKQELTKEIKVFRNAAVKAERALKRMKEGRRS